MDKIKVAIKIRLTSKKEFTGQVFIVLKEHLGNEYCTKLGNDLSLRTSKTPPRKAAYDWKVLRGDGNLQQLYTVKVLNRYEQLCIESQSDVNDTTETYENLIHANSEAAKELNPPKTRSKRKVISNNPDVISARLKVNSAFSNYEKTHHDGKGETVTG